MSAAAVVAGLLLAALPTAAGVTATTAVTTTVAAAGTVAPHRVCTVDDPRIVEQSAAVVSPTHPDLLWLVNDSGDSARVFGISSTTCRTRAVLQLRTDARDTESMAVGTDGRGHGLLWVGDTGDNRQVRTSVVLRLVREPAQVRSQSLDVVSLRVRYAFGPTDVEAMFWTPDGRLFLVTKQLLSGTVLQVPASAVSAALAGRSTARPVVAQLVATVQQSLVTDASVLPDGRVLLRDYLGAVLYTQPAEGRMVPVDDVPLPRQAQGESIASDRTGRVAYAGSEGRRQPLWRVALPPEPPGLDVDGRAAPSASGRPAARTAGAGSGTSGGSAGLPGWAPYAAGAVAAVALFAAVTGARRRGRRTR